MRPALAAAALNVFEIELLEFSAFEVADCGFEALVFALPALQQVECDANNFGWPFEDARRNLRIDKLLLLASELDHLSRIPRAA